MTSLTTAAPIPGASARQAHPRRTLAVAGFAHALHDGYTDLIYVMLPVWQKEFGLGYAELGLLRGLFSGTMAGFQIPSGLIAERVGTAPVLALGTALVGTGYCLAGASAGFGLLVVALFVGGLGASTQHPLASSLMARAFAGPRSMKALGTYNFAGDIGKMTLPAAAALLLVAMSWRPALALLGGLGLLAAVAIFVLTPRYGPEIPSQAAHRDLHSAAGDPNFNDPAQGDFGIREGSPARKVGFENFAMDGFGVTSPKLRAEARKVEIPRLKVPPN